MSNINSFREKLQSLISKFEKDKSHYLSKGYPEAQVRIDFINPFFKALGWDIENKAQKPPHERDVLVELSPEITRRPDYNFRIHGATKFFIEAKAPSVALDDVNHILQAKSYAWSTKEVYFVILTDFEEFKLFDASLKPNPRFPNEGLIFDFKYSDYLANIEKLWELSRERVEQGSLEALLPRDTKSKRLRVPPDKSFLEDLTIWRTELAKDIHKRNPDFDTKLLNDVVQKLLDRIIFIRIAEDRKIRPDRELWEIVAQWKEEGKRKSIMMHLIDLFHEVNDDLNGDIFKPHACENASVDSNLLADIIENLYFPKSRYRFDAIGVELLGSIYERYLGSTIRVTPQRVKVEEKPEVRKAGGVYYTPKYIVDYIVKNTVGKIIEGKTPRQIANIKILDPACGSGSFLLGAYQCLIDYHLEYYRNHPKEAQTQFFDFYYKVGPEDLALPLRTKAAILRNNIFGVDIDPQAAEITMMSLYLKALEGERGLLPKKQHLLPPLSNNIKCGNSLIGYDIFDSLPLEGGGQGRGWDDETKSRINPFDWNSKSAGFGEIIENGGFDVVIGNPPYVRIQAMKEWAPIEVEFYKKNYVSASKGNYDIYVVFVEKGLKLLNKTGRMGFILPSKFFATDYGQALRQLIVERKALSDVVDFGHSQVFENATTYTCLLFLSGKPVHSVLYAKVAEPLKLPAEDSHFIKIKQDTFKAESWIFSSHYEKNISDKLLQKSIPLSNLPTRIGRGSSTGADNVFVLNKKGGELLTQTDEIVDVESEILRVPIHATDFGRYRFNPISEKVIIFPYNIVPDGYELKSELEMKKCFPKAYKYLLNRKKELERRKQFKSWYGFSAPRNLEVHDSAQMLVPLLADRGLYCRLPDNTNKFCLMASGGFSITIASSCSFSPNYVFGLLNSTLLFWQLQRISNVFRGGWITCTKQYVETLPIHTIDFNNPSETDSYDKLVSLVERMLELHKKKTSLPPSAEREKIEREIMITDEKIDEIVYGLYGITEEEKKIIYDKL